MDKENKENNKIKEAAGKTREVKVEKKDANVSAGQAVAKPAPANATVGKSVYGEKRKFARNMRKGRMGRDKKKDDFEQRILDLARVTRVMAGGKRMRFRACVVIGDRKGKVAVALGKGADVTIAVTKGVNRAKKNIIDVPMVNETIPHEIYQKYGAAKILFKPARKGRGVIAGGVVRVILELAGIHNVTSKILGTNNKVNNAKCTIEALKRLKRVEMKKQENKKETIKNKNPKF